MEVGFPEFRLFENGYKRKIWVAAAFDQTFAEFAPGVHKHLGAVVFGQAITWIAS